MDVVVSSVKAYIAAMNKMLGFKETSSSAEKIPVSSSTAWECVAALFRAACAQPKEEGNVTAASLVFQVSILMDCGSILIPIYLHFAVSSIFIHTSRLSKECN